MGQITDPVSDMFTRMRNAIMRYHTTVDIPCSRFKIAILNVLKDEGYIKNFKKIEDYKQGILRVFLKYGPKRERIINEIKSISKPGRRIYRRYEKLPYVYGGLGTAIISTSEGVMTGADARRRHLGGEVICTIF